MANIDANTGRIDDEFVHQLKGFGLSTIEVHYYMPDHPALLQVFAFQQYDRAPDFPRLDAFLDHWRREIEAAIHSIRVAHGLLIGPREFRAVNGVITLH